MGDPERLRDLLTGNPLLLTPEEAATVLRIGRTTIYALIMAGDLRPVHIGRSCRLPRTELERYVRSLETHPDIAPGLTGQLEAARSSRRRIDTALRVHAKSPSCIAVGDNAPAIHRFVATASAPGAPMVQSPGRCRDSSCP